MLKENVKLVVMSVGLRERSVQLKMNERKCKSVLPCATLQNDSFLGGAAGTAEFGQQRKLSSTLGVGGNFASCLGNPSLGFTLLLLSPSIHN